VPGSTTSVAAQEMRWVAVRHTIGITHPKGNARRRLNKGPAPAWDRRADLGDNDRFQWIIPAQRPRARDRGASG
jgi:hypothetical protein